MYEEIAQKKILVVGASRGIGRQLCHAIDGLGGHVIAAARDVHSWRKNFFFFWEMRSGFRERESLIDSWTSELS